MLISLYREHVNAGWSYKREYFLNGSETAKKAIYLKMRVRIAEEWRFIYRILNFKFLLKRSTLRFS